MLKRITEFETQHTVLGKRRVAHSEEILTSAKIAAVDVSQRNETLTRDLIVNQRVAVGESPALNVLSRQSNVVTFVEQRRKSQRFSHGPIYPFTAVDHGATIFVHTLHDAMRVKPPVLVMRCQGFANVRTEVRCLRCATTGLGF